MTRPLRQVDDRAAVLAEPGRHWPARPSWTCAAGCGDWPCAPLRGHLLATRTRGEISALMADYYDVAMRELELESTEVHLRLFAWARHEGWHPVGGPL